MDSRRGPACPACKYSLRGLASEGLCPECGLRYTPLTVVWIVDPGQRQRDRASILIIAAPLVLGTLFGAARAAPWGLFAMVVGGAMALLPFFAMAASLYDLAVVHPARRLAIASGVGAGSIVVIYLLLMEPVIRSWLGVPAWAAAVAYYGLVVCALVVPAVMLRILKRAEQHAGGGLAAGRERPR